MTNKHTAQLISEAVERFRTRVEKRLDAYATERDWQKLREWEMADIAAEEATVELTKLALDLRRGE